MNYKTALSAFTLGISSVSFAQDCYTDNTWGLVGEWTMMRRSLLHSERIVKSDSDTSCTGCDDDDSVLSTGPLVSEFDYEPGFRVGAYYHPSERRSLELLYLDCGKWHSEKEVNGDDDLSFPFKCCNYTHDFREASEAKAKYNSNFWTAEFNYWRHVTPRFEDYFSVSWLAGLRYVNLHEKFNVAFLRDANESHYRISVENYMPGIQLGGNVQFNPQRSWSWDLTAKIGVLVDIAEQKTYLGDYNDSVTLRNHEGEKTGATFLAEVAAALAYQFNTHFNIHGGYQMLYLSGIALAPEQISKRTGPHSGSACNLDGQAIVHGWFLGLSFGF